MAESMESSAFDLITMGRIGVDLYPLQTVVASRPECSSARPALPEIEQALTAGAMP